MGPYLWDWQVVICQSVRNLASTMTADRHRPLQALQQHHRTTQILDEGGFQANWVSAKAGSGSDKWLNQREANNVYLYRLDSSLHLRDYVA